MFIQIGRQAAITTCQGGRELALSSIHVTNDHHNRPQIARLRKKTLIESLKGGLTHSSTSRMSLSTRSFDSSSPPHIHYRPSSHSQFDSHSPHPPPSPPTLHPSAYTYATPVTPLPCLSYRTPLSAPPSWPSRHIYPISESGEIQVIEPVPFDLSDSLSSSATLEKKLSFEEWFQSKSLEIETRMTEERHRAFQRVILVLFRRYLANRAFLEWSRHKDLQKRHKQEEENARLEWLQEENIRLIEANQNAFEAWLQSKNAEEQRVQSLSDSFSHYGVNSSADKSLAAKREEAFQKWKADKDAQARAKMEQEEKLSLAKAKQAASKKADAKKRGDELYSEWIARKDRDSEQAQKKDDRAREKKSQIKSARHAQFEAKFGAFVKDCLGRVAAWKESEQKAKQSQEQRHRRVHTTVSSEDFQRTKLSVMPSQMSQVLSSTEKAQAAAASNRTLEIIRAASEKHKRKLRRRPAWVE